MGHIALEVPLSAFTIVRRWQRHHAAHTRIETLRDALDRTALAGGIPPFEQDHDLLSGGDYPVLQLHQFRLQAKQLPEVLTPIFLLRLAIRRSPTSGQRMMVLELHLEL